MANLLGTIDGQTAIVIAEKTPFAVDESILASFVQPKHISALSLIERNDIYHWFLATQAPGELPQYPGAKITLIFPATEAHIRKYSAQNARMVTETSEIYRKFVKPYLETKCDPGRLNWVYNILEKKKESESIIFEDPDEKDGFILLPDLKWDRSTMNSLYVMALVHRRGIRSIRDLTKKDAPWLRRMQGKIIQGLCEKYPELESDRLRLYVHYQPSYYHFHIHVVSISHDGGGGQATGKAIIFQNLISQLETMAGGDDAGFEDIELTYILGEESDLWQNVFSKLRKGEL